MDALIALLVILVSFVGLDLAAVRWGADSRPPIADDHRR